jgi:hypothetical protein
MTATETKTYNVYLHREIGVKFLAVEADSPEDAASTAGGMATGGADRIDDGDALSARVELAEPGGDQPAVTLDFPVGRLRKAAPDLLGLLRDISLAMHAGGMRKPKAWLERIDRTIAKAEAA